MPDRNEFLGTYTPLANDIAQQTGLDPSVVLGIIDNETGGGTRVKGNNIFGISPTGPAGQYVKPYPDVETAARDFITLMQTPRYRAVGTFTDPSDQTQALVRARYNTVDPNWAAKVGNSAQRFGRALGYQDQQDGGAQPGASASADPELDELKAQQTKPATPPPGAAPTKSDADDPELAELKEQAACKGGKQTGPPLKEGLPQATEAGDQFTAAPAPESPLARFYASAPGNFWAPGGRDIVANTGWLGRNVLAPAGDIAGMALSVPNAAFRGAQEWLQQPEVAQANPLVPQQAWRDIAAMPEAFPTGVGNLRPGTQMPFTRPTPPSPRFVQEYYGEPYPGQRIPPQPREAGAPVTLSDLTDAIKRADGDTPMPPGTGTVDPEDYVPAGEARSGGAAATPAGAIPDQTRVERARNLRMSIDQSERDRAGPGLIDDTPYVTDVPGGTLAPRMYSERNFDPQVALDHKKRYATDTDYRTQFDANTNDRNADMVALLRRDAGDGNSLDALEKTRREVAPKAFGAFDGETAVDSQRLVDGIDRYMDSPDAKVGSAQRMLNNVRSSMYDQAGNLEVIPSRLYGVKQNIDSLMEKGKRPTDAEGADAKASMPILRALSGDVNNLIQSGAPKYQAYRQAYREASQPVNQQRFLQKYQEGGKKLTNDAGDLQLRRVNQMLEDIHKGLTDTRPNYAQSLTNDQIQNVINVRNELAAKQLRDMQGRVPGSDSYQLFNAAAASGTGPLGVALRGAGHILGHAAAFKVGGALGLGAGELNALLGAYEMTVAPARKAARIKKAVGTANALAAARDAQLLSQEPARNPLAGP